MLLRFAYQHEFRRIHVDISEICIGEFGSQIRDSLLELPVKFLSYFIVRLHAAEFVHLIGLHGGNVPGCQGYAADGTCVVYPESSCPFLV